MAVCRTLRGACRGFSGALVRLSPGSMHVLHAESDSMHGAGTIGTPVPSRTPWLSSVDERRSAGIIEWQRASKCSPVRGCDCGVRPLRPFECSRSAGVEKGTQCLWACAMVDM